jgi:hypothetical protein
MRFVLRRSVTVSMVSGYRSSSVRLSKHEGQAERALVRTGNSASSTGLNRSTAASIPAVGAPVLLECPRGLTGWMGEQARSEGPQTPEGASAACGAADEGDSRAGRAGGDG